MRSVLTHYGTGAVMIGTEEVEYDKTGRKLMELYFDARHKLFTPVDQCAGYEYRYDAARQPRAPKTR